MSWALIRQIPTTSSQFLSQVIEWVLGECASSHLRVRYILILSRCYLTEEIAIMRGVEYFTYIRIDKNDFLQRPQDTSSRTPNPHIKRRVTAAIRKKKPDAAGETGKVLVNRGRAAATLNTGSASSSTASTQTGIATPRPTHDTESSVINDSEARALQHHGDGSATRMELNKLGVANEPETLDPAQWPFYQSKYHRSRYSLQSG